METLQTLFTNQRRIPGTHKISNGNHLFRIGINRGHAQSGIRSQDKESEAQLAGLTAREKEVLQFVAEGKANKETASALAISMKTVEKHRGQLMEKLGIRGTAGLTRYAIYVGIISCNPYSANHANLRA
jgi:DNA-binding NarL/FixJ family response regulator